MALSGWKNKLGERWVSRKTADKASSPSLYVDDIAVYRLFNAGTAPTSNTAIYLPKSSVNVSLQSNNKNGASSLINPELFYPKNADKNSSYVNFTTSLTPHGQAWESTGTPVSGDYVDFTSKKVIDLFRNAPGWALFHIALKSTPAAGFGESIFAKVDGVSVPNGGWVVYINNDLSIGVSCYSSGTDLQMPASTANVIPSDSTWHTVLVTFTGNALSSSCFSVYVDGIDVTGAITPSDVTLGTDENFPLRMGGGYTWLNRERKAADIKLNFAAFGRGLLSDNVKIKISSNYLLAFNAIKSLVLYSIPTPSGESLTVSITDLADTISINASGSATATPAITAPNDTIAATASGSYTATVAITDVVDTISANASGAATLTASITAPNDTIAITETQNSTATISITDIADTVAGNASGLATVDVSITDLADTITVSISSAGDSVTVTITDSRDTIAASEAQTSTVTAAITDLTDTITVTASGLSSVDAAITAPNDTIVVSITDVVISNVDVSITDLPDVISALETQSETVSLSITDLPDVISINASGLPAPASSATGGAYNIHPRLYEVKRPKKRIAKKKINQLIEEVVQEQSEYERLLSIKYKPIVYKSAAIDELQQLVDAMNNRQLDLYNEHLLIIQREKELIKEHNKFIHKYNISARLLLL
jgi:hypothetical protein